MAESDVKSTMLAQARDTLGIPESLANDSKYKKYVAQVDKCLATFDNVHEWADFIAFLTKLLKAFQSFMQYKEIPRKLVVAKRLAQCLNPALPNGVHQRALDVYAHVLAVLGLDGLKRDLLLWSSGLFPFFEYAATSVKPALLNLYDTHFLPLGPSLRPATRALILALLPGLEEEQGEFFDKVLALLDRLAGTVGTSFFFMNVWLVLVSAPSARAPALNLLARRLPKVGPDDDLTSVVGSDAGLMIRAFAAALEDENMLVRRGILELLCTTLRLDGDVMKKAQPLDRTILMRAATSVVLRRDLSLSRRLFAWLLGNAEKPAAQVSYLKEHGLALLVSTLKEDMYAVNQTGDTRPFKIFVSLLDRWEIGGPATEALVIDALTALQSGLGRAENNDDIMMAATTLYEAVEPQILWQQLYTDARREILGHSVNPKEIIPKQSEAMQIPVIRDALQLIVDTIPHTPSAALLEKLDVFSPVDPAEPPTSPLSPGGATITSPLAESSELNQPPTSPAPRPHGTIGRADVFYGVPQLTSDLLPMSERPHDSIPFTTLFEDAAAICKRPYVKLATSLMSALLVRVKEKVDTAVVVGWEPEQWVTGVMGEVQQGPPFVVVDSVVSLIVRLSRSTVVQPGLKVNKRPQIEQLVYLLLGYLQPKFTPYHVRAAQLLWDVQGIVSHHDFESIIAKSLASQKQGESGAYEAFGVLWRLTGYVRSRSSRGMRTLTLFRYTDDSLVPGYRCKVPLLIVLDTLRSEDVHVRRVGETWMRYSLKSYIRVIEPVLFDLLDPAVKRNSATFTFNGRDTRGYVYERPMDQRKFIYILETLLSVVRYGGQGFGRVARTTIVQRTMYPGLMARAEAAQVVHPNATFLDVLVDVLLRIVQSEPKEQLAAQMQIYNNHIHTVTLDLIQAVVSRGEIDLPTLETIEATIVSKLYMSVHTDRIDLQNKLLHTLHSTIFATTSTALPPPGTAPGSPRPAPARIAPLPGSSVEEFSSGDAHLSKLPGSINPLLVQTLTDGISRNAHTPILQHWIDFVLVTIPHFQQSQALVALPLVDCVCKQVQSALDSIQELIQNRRSNEADHVSTVTDAEVIVLLNALERLVLLSITRTPEAGPADEDDAASEKDSGGLFGIVSTVFTSDSNPSAAGDRITPLSPTYRSLYESVGVLHSLWIASAWNPSSPPHAMDESISLTYGRARLRCRKVLERIFRVHSAEVLEIIVEYWDKGEDSAAMTVRTFEIVDLLAASAQTVVHMLCESISMRLPSSIGDRGRRPSTQSSTLSDVVLFKFLQEYLAKLEGPIVNQVWGRFMSLLKDVAANIQSHRAQVFPALQCLVVAAEKQAMTAALDDKRVKKDLQDFMNKLIDACLQISARSIDGPGSRKGTREALVGAANGRASPSPSPIARVKTNDASSEKINASPAEASAKVSAAWEFDMPDEINLFFAKRLVPNLRKFMVENDKVIAVCTNIVYYVINPAIRAKSKNALDNQPTIMTVMEALVKQQVAVRTWRPALAEAFEDQRFFARDVAAGTRWCPLIKAYMLSDKLAIPDIVDRCLAQLPSIQEKLVELLRWTSTEPVIHSEIYLCVRVLLCRLSPHNMSSFWPVILTELIRLFTSALVEPPQDSSDELQLLLAACKCVDLMLVLQTPEFQIHQWMFVTDTMDAVYRPDTWIPTPLMDQLAEVIGGLPQSEQNATILPSPPTTNRPALPGNTQNQRRPLLSAVRRVDRLGELLPFFSHVSIALYEGVYAGGSPDTEAIERGLLEEMFTT
ncbi:hypothetical protein FRC10_004853 [Ceratobasidium sp. 414]|nr:hypothetical protein FRC10_004853 [Ceratobasidium sp. 414]